MSKPQTQSELKLQEIKSKLHKDNHGLYINTPGYAKNKVDCDVAVIFNKFKV